MNRNERTSAALSTLDELDAYLANRQDVVDGDYGAPEPNEEMVLLRELRKVRSAFAALISTSKDAAWLLGHLNHMTKLPEVNAAIDRDLAPLIAALGRVDSA